MSRGSDHGLYLLVNQINIKSGVGVANVIFNELKHN